MLTPDDFNSRGADYLPGHLGLVITQVSGGEVRSELHVKKLHLAPNGYLHAGTVITLADTVCGYGCAANLPEGAAGFTTIELKSNHLGTARDGMLECVGQLEHAGKTTQVWSAVVSHRDTGKRIALFRCTQLILYSNAKP